MDKKSGDSPVDMVNIPIIYKALAPSQVVGKGISEPIASMYGIFTYIYHKNQPNVGKYTIHGCCGEPSTIWDQDIAKLL